jgi:hypothetical protein
MNLHPTIASQITTYRIAEGHQQAARQRLARELRAGGPVRPRDGSVRAGWARLSLRRSRPAAA